MRMILDIESRAPEYALIAPPASQLHNDWYFYVGLRN